MTFFPPFSLPHVKRAKELHITHSQSSSHRTYDVGQVSKILFIHMFILPKWIFKIKFLNKTGQYCVSRDANAISRLIVGLDQWRKILQADETFPRIA